MIGRALSKWGTWRKIDLSRKDLRSRPDERNAENSPRPPTATCLGKFQNMYERDATVGLCRDIYEEQVSQGNHFHVWDDKPTFEDLEEDISDVFPGTLSTYYHQSDGIPKGAKYAGNNHLRQGVA